MFMQIEMLKYAYKYDYLKELVRTVRENVEKNKGQRDVLV